MNINIAILEQSKSQIIAYVKATEEVPFTTQKNSILGIEEGYQPSEEFNQAAMAAFSAVSAAIRQALKTYQPDQDNETDMEDFYFWKSRAEGGDEEWAWAVTNYLMAQAVRFGAVDAGDLVFQMILAAAGYRWETYVVDSHWCGRVVKA